MLGKLLKPSAIALFILGCLFCFTAANGQEYFDAANTPRQYYYNNFEAATANTPATFFANGGSTRTSAFINVVSGSSLNGTKSLSTTGSNTIGNMAWNFMSNSTTGSNTSLANAAWEWEFDYKNTTGGATGDCTVTMAAGSNSWRYYLLATTYTPDSYDGNQNNPNPYTVGLYLTHYNGNLILRYKYGPYANQYTDYASVSMPNNTNTYQIRVERQGPNGYYRIFVLNRTTNTTTISNEINIGSNPGTAYNLSFLQATSSTANRFQFDNFNFYKVKLEYVPITDDPAGLSNPVYPGMGNAIPFAVKVNVRGDVYLGRFVIKYTGDARALFSDGSLYKKPINQTLSTTGATFLGNFGLNNDKTNQLELSATEYYYSGGLTTGATVNVINYFFYTTVRNPFSNGYPTSLAYSVSNDPSDTYNQFYQTDTGPYNSGSSVSVTTPTPSGDVYDWTGANTSWTTSGSWKRNTSSTTTNPSATDIVRIGVVAYTGANQPQLAGNVSVSVVKIGKLGSISGTTAAPVVLDLASKNITVSNGLTVDAGANLTLRNTNTSGTPMFNVAGTSFVASTGAINFTNSGSAPGVTLANTGTFTLLSDINGSAAIGTLNGTAKVTGTFKVQRYVSGGSIDYRGYRLFSSPVYEGVVGGINVYGVAYTKNSAYLTGTTGTAGGFDATSTTPTIYLYREDKTPSTSATGGNFRGVNKINNATSYNLNLDNETGSFNIPAGGGFMFFFRGDRATNPTTRTTPIPDAVSFTTTGTLNQGNIQVRNWYTPTSTNLGYTASAPTSARGYNLVGNPYPSTIDWNNFSRTNASANIYGPGLVNATYVYNAAAKTYSVWDGSTGTNFATRYIPSGQGFYVLANAASPSLLFKEGAKVSVQVTGNNLLMGTPIAETASPQFIKLQLSKEDDVKEDIVIKFNKSASTGYTLGEDLPYMRGSSAVSLSTLASDNKEVSLAINQVPFPKKKTSIPLNVSVNTSDIYQLKLSQLNEIPKMFEIWLMDAYKKDSLDIRNNLNYNFNVNTADAATFGTDRFTVVICPNVAYSYHLLNFAAAKQGTAVQLTWKAENEENYTYFTVERSTNGGKSFDVVGSSVGKGLSTYSAQDKAPVNGENQYRLKQEDYFGTITYSKVLPVMFTPAKDNIADERLVSVYPNPTNANLSIAVKNTTLNAVAYSISITNTSGRTVKTITSAQPAWQGNVSDLLPGTYFIMVTNNKDKSVVGKSTFIKI
jgi:hypothetical protein